MTLERDARRYEQLVLALSEAHQELQELEQAGITDIEQAIDQLLPRIVAAFGAGYALLTRFDHISENLHIVCCHPFSVWRGQLASPSERTMQAIFEGRARIFESIPGYNPILFIESPAGFEPSAVIFTTFQTPSKNYQVWVCDHQDPSWGPFVGADRLALESIIGLFVGFANIGERRRKELEKIQAISTQITANVDLELLMPELTRLAAQAFGAPAASVMLWNQQHDELVINAAFGLSDKYQENLRIQRNTLEEILQTHPPSLRTMFTPDLQESPFAQGDLVRGENVRSALSTKLITEDEWLGVLNIYSLGTIRNFTADEKGLIEILANQAAIAIFNARNRKELIKGFLDTSTMLQTGLNRQETINLVVDKAVEVLKVDEACLFTWDSSNPTSSVYTHSGKI